MQKFDKFLMQIRVLFATTLSALLEINEFTFGANQPGYESGMNECKFNYCESGMRKLDSSDSRPLIKTLMQLIIHALRDALDAKRTIGMQNTLAGVLEILIFSLTFISC